MLVVQSHLEDPSVPAAFAELLCILMLSPVSKDCGGAASEHYHPRIALKSLQALKVYSTQPAWSEMVLE